MTLIVSPPRSVTCRLQVFTSFDDAEAIAAEWDDLVSELNGSLYSSRTWCEVWWRHYGTDRDLRLIAIRAADELVGVLPFFIDRLRVPIGRARVAKLVSSDSTVAVIEPLVDPSMATEAFTLALKRLFEDDGVDMVYPGPLSGATSRIYDLRRAAEEISDVAELLLDRESGSHTVFDMSEGFDEYLRSLSSHQRSNYRRKLKKLSNAFNAEVDVVRDAAALEREFEAFVEMHQTQWKAVNKLGHFGDWPASLEFSRDLVRTFSETDGVRLVRLLADDKVVAYYWCFALGGTYYWRLSARLFGEEWDQFALGRVGVVKMMEAAAAEGTTAIEAGIGSYGYKENLNANTFPLHSLAVCRRGGLPRLRARFTLAYGHVLDLAFYRLWYIRIAPRMKIFRRPLRRSWIRRRF